MSTSKYQNKPLSPHLTIYKPQLTSMMSISHRITGFVLFISLISLSWLLNCFIYDFLANKQHLLSEVIKFDYFILVSKIILSIICFAAFYHLLNGIRHLYWDIGKGFDLKSVYRSGYIVIFGSIILTIYTLYILL